MKIKEAHIKILENFMHYNNAFAYDGNRLLKTRNVGGDAYIEVYLKDFIDIPIYTKDLVSILNFLKTDTDISVESVKNVNYILLKNENGTIRYRLSNENIVKNDALNNYSFDNIIIDEEHFNFNLDYQKYKNLMRTAKLLECDRLEVFSIDEHKIGLRAYNMIDKDNKQYVVEIEQEHKHTDVKDVIILKLFELAQATDYNIQTGYRTNSKGRKIAIAKIKAFWNDIEAKYMIINKEVTNA